MVLCETWTLWNDWKLANPLDARFLQGGPQAGLTHSTLGSQATFTILAATPLLEPSVNLERKKYEFIRKYEPKFYALKRYFSCAFGKTVVV